MTNDVHLSQGFCLNYQQNLHSRHPVKKMLTLLPASVVANSLDPDHERQNIFPDLNPKCLILNFLFPLWKLATHAS